MILFSIDKYVDIGINYHFCNMLKKYSTYIRASSNRSVQWTAFLALSFP